MSYDIYIGEARLDVPGPEDTDGNEIVCDVASFTHPEAPAFPGDDMTGHSNGRHPGYSQWTHFCEEVGLHDLFFGARRDKTTGRSARDVGLMTKHPGCYLLRQSDLDEVRLARRRWEARPWRATERIAGWDPNSTWTTPAESMDQRYDNHLARLLWLEWWITWALANCKVPAIYNR